MTTPAVTVAPAERPEWAYAELEQDFDARCHVWREVAESFYWQALEVLPPLYAEGGFLVGEPWSHTTDGHPIRAGFAKVGERYFAIMSTRRNFPHLARALREQVAA